MSMIAQFVQVSPDRLARLIKHPSGTEDLFAALPAASNVPPISKDLLANLTEGKRKEFLARGPQMLQETLARLDPKLREAMRKRLGELGLDVAGLESGAGGEELLNLIKARAAGAPADAAGQGEAISIDKSWHGIHYLLCAAALPTTTLISQVIMGGTEIGDDFSGYGPARYFAADETAAMSAELSRANLEADMMARFNPTTMTKLGIYPNQWAGPDAQWLMREFRHIRDLYAGASARGFAVITCLV